MRKFGVGVIGASPLRPGWAVAAHLPAIAHLPNFELRAVATSSETSAKAAGDAYGVPAYSDARSMIARSDIDLVVVTVKITHHYELVSEAIAAGKAVMCEWPLGIDLEQSEHLASLSSRHSVGNLIGLQARMAPSIRYARDLIEQGYVGDVLATTMVGSGIAWTSVSDTAHAYMFDVKQNATLVSVPTMHAIDALQFVLGDLADIRAVSATRNRLVTLADTGQQIESSAPDQVAIAATLEGGGVASVFYRGGTSRGENFRWEINGSKGDLVITSSLGNLQVLPPALLGGHGADTSVVPLKVPDGYDLAGHAPDGPAGNVARLYAAFAQDVENQSSGQTAPDFRHAVQLHKTLARILE